MTLLENDKVQFNSFNTANTRRKAFIVRGLCYGNHQDGIDAIKAALAALQIGGRIDVSLFETAYLRHHPNAKRAPLFRIVVGSNVNTQLILDIRTIGQFGVRIEQIKKSVMGQCRNCQRYHHSSNQCHFDYRCVQCSTPHDYGKCPRAVIQALPIGCVNCFDAKLIYTDHTANDFKNCNFFKRATTATSETPSRGTAGHATGTNASVTANRTGSRSTNKHAAGGNINSYASLLRTSVPNKNVINGLDADQLTTIITAAVGSALSALLGGARPS